MTWTARIISEGETEQEATGVSPDDAVLILLADIMESWKRGEYSICGDYIKEIGEAIVTLERRDEDSEFVSQCGDFSQPWKLVVTRDVCNQIGNGCTCGECSQTIIDAVGLDPDHVFEDDCDLVLVPDFTNLRSRVEHTSHRMGYVMDFNTIPNRLWDLWSTQGQCLQQMASLCREFDASPESF